MSKTVKMMGGRIHLVHNGRAETLCRLSIWSDLPYWDGYEVINSHFQEQNYLRFCPKCWLVYLDETLIK